MFFCAVVLLMEPSTHLETKPLEIRQGEVIRVFKRRPTTSNNEVVEMQTYKVGKQGQKSRFIHTTLLDAGAYGEISWFGAFQSRRGDVILLTGIWRYISCQEIHADGSSKLIKNRWWDPNLVSWGFGQAEVEVLEAAGRQPKWALDFKPTPSDEVYVDYRWDDKRHEWYRPRKRARRA